MIAQISGGMSKCDVQQFVEGVQAHGWKGQFEELIFQSLDTQGHGSREGRRSRAHRRVLEGVSGGEMAIPKIPKKKGALQGIVGAWLSIVLS